MHRRGFLGSILAGLAASVRQQRAHGGEPQIGDYRGKVVSLTQRLRQAGIAVDADASLLLAVETSEGKILPLVPDAGSLAFFRDARLRERPVRLRGRLIPGTGMLQVLQAHLVKDGRLYSFHYWCETCAIQRLVLEKTGVCECCGGPMELREEAARQ
jgi:hypothetical protein